MTRIFIYNNTNITHRYIYTLYPKFDFALTQFSPDFFINKIKELSLRLFIGGNFILYIHYLIYSKHKLNRLYLPIPKYQIEFYACFFYPYLLYTGLSWYSGFSTLDTIQHQYSAISFLKMIPDTIASTTSIYLLWILLIISILCILFSKYKFIASMAVAITFLLLETIFNSFGKISHGYTPLIYCSLVFPLLYSSHQKKWVITLIQISIVACYTFAGLEKVLNGGYHWFNGSQLQGYLESMSPYNHYLQTIPSIVFTLFAIAIILFQLSFSLILFYKKLIPYYIILGFLFHLGIYFSLDIGHWLHPWIITYLFFINRDFIAKFYQQTTDKTYIQR